MISPGIFFNGLVHENINKLTAKKITESLPTPPDQKCMFGRNKISGNRGKPKSVGLTLLLFRNVKKMNTKPANPNSEKRSEPAQNDNPRTCENG